MAHDRAANLAARPAAADPPAPFSGLLSPGRAGQGDGGGADPSVLADLRLDQVIEAVASRTSQKIPAVNLPGRKAPHPPHIRQIRAGD
jgi:hypothetical protein